MSAVLTPARHAHRESPRYDETTQAPIVVSVDASERNGAVVSWAVDLAVKMDAPLVFAYVRRGPAGILGRPYYERRLTKELRRARRTLDRALAAARAAEVDAEAEILEGPPRRRVLELARHRGAQLIVAGSGKGRFVRKRSNVQAWFAGGSRGVPAARGLPARP